MNIYHNFLNQKGRRIIKNVHYFIIYEKYFERYINRPVTFFEIGTGDGGSARMWKEYFGAMARIVTIDVQDRKFVEESQIFFRRGSQDDPAFLKSLVEEFGAPDIVFDDGSHHMLHINKTFDVLFPLLSSSGVYLVEDLNAAYIPAQGGGYKKPGTFIERCKDLIDEVNRGAPQSVYGKSIFSISFFDKVVVIEKTPYVNTELLNLPAVQ